MNTKRKVRNTNKTISRIDFFKKYCRNCGSQSCDGVDLAWAPECKFYGEFNIKDELRKKTRK